MVLRVSRPEQILIQSWAGPEPGWATSLGRGTKKEILCAHIRRTKQPFLPCDTTCHWVSWLCSPLGPPYEMHQQLYPRRRLGERRTVCPSRHGPESNRSRNAARQRIWRVFKGGLRNRVLRFNPKRAACDWVSGHCHPAYLPATNTRRKLADEAPLGPPHDS